MKQQYCRNLSEFNTNVFKEIEALERQATEGDLHALLICLSESSGMFRHNSQRQEKTKERPKNSESDRSAPLLSN